MLPEDTQIYHEKQVIINNFTLVIIFITIIIHIRIDLLLLQI